MAAEVSSAVTLSARRIRLLGWETVEILNWKRPGGRVEEHVNPSKDGLEVLLNIQTVPKSGQESSLDTTYVSHLLIRI